MLHTMRASNCTRDLKTPTKKAVWVVMNSALVMYEPNVIVGNIYLFCFGPSLPQVDPTYRSLLEETSVDYIQKFRELATQMNTDQWEYT